MDKIYIISIVVILIIILCTLIFAYCVIPQKTIDDATATTITRISSGFTKSVDAVLNPIIKFNRFTPEYITYSYDPNNDPLKILANYNINDPTAYIVKDWDIDGDALSKACNVLINTIAAIYSNRYASVSSKLSLDCIYEFIERFSQKILVQLTTGFTGIPWGTSWAPFTIDIPNLLVAYITKELNVQRKNRVLNLLETLVQSPTMVMNNTLTDKESVYVTFPWIYSKYIGSSAIVDAVQSDTYYKAIQYAAFPITFKYMDGGRHVDFTFIGADGSLNYNNFYDVANKCDNLYRFDSELRKQINYVGKPRTMNPFLELITKLLLHSSISFCPTGIFKDYVAPLGNGKLGTVVLPSGKFMRYFSTNSTFSVRGQLEIPMSTHKHHSEYRGLCTKNTTTKDKCGLVFNSTDTGFEKIMYDSQQTPTDAICVVFKTDSGIGLMYNKFTINAYTREEFIICDQNNIHIYVEVTSKTEEECVIYVDSATQYPTRNKQASIKITHTLSTNKTLSEPMSFPKDLVYKNHKINKTPDGSIWYLLSDNLIYAVHKIKNMNEGANILLNGNIYKHLNGQYVA